MAIKIVTAQTPMQGYDVGQIPIDVSRKTGVLIRQSRKGADKDHYESRLQTRVPCSRCNGVTGRY